MFGLACLLTTHTYHAHRELAHQRTAWDHFLDVSAAAPQDTAGFEVAGIPALPPDLLAFMPTAFRDPDMPPQAVVQSSKSSANRHRVQQRFMQLTTKCLEGQPGARPSFAAIEKEVADMMEVRPSRALAVHAP